MTTTTSIFVHVMGNNIRQCNYSLQTNIGEVFAHKLEHKPRRIHVSLNCSLTLLPSSRRRRLYLLDFATRRNKKPNMSLARRKTNETVPSQYKKGFVHSVCGMPKTKHDPPRQNYPSVTLTRIFLVPLFGIAA